MKKVYVFMIISGILLILAAVLSLGEVVYVEQVNFLARITIFGAVCVGFGAVMLAQKTILERISWEAETVEKV